MRWMHGMSQSEARRQLRKRLVFTSLLKEIVGILLRRPWEPGRERAAWRPPPPPQQPVLRVGRGASRKGCVSLGESLHFSGPQPSGCNME